MTGDPLADSRERAGAAYAAGDARRGHEILRAALAGALDLEALNDLAVLAHASGAAEEAVALLDAVLAIDPEREDARENRAALEQAGDGAAWRASAELGGSNPKMAERAFPGMGRADVLSEHTLRYSFALGFVGDRHVLDLGCGTAYGSEMLSWAAASVRGYDLWEPTPEQRPRWPGPTELNYGHDLCRDPLPPADVAVMFEVIEHLPDAPAALRIAWRAVDTIVGSFPNPVHHGSWMNEYHVNDWTLEEFEAHLTASAAERWGAVDLEHYHQPVGSALVVPGRDPDASFWIAVARGSGEPRHATLRARVTAEGRLPARADADVLKDSLLDYWHKRVEQHLTDTYAGVRLLKFPEDLRVYEHLLWLSRADTVIEIGTRFGGSALWFRDRLRTQHAHGRTVAEPLVVTLDVDLSQATGALEGEEGIVAVEGDVLDADLPDRVAGVVPPAARCLVVEDSAHTYDTTYMALQGFARFVAPGGWFVVEDGCVDLEPLRRTPDDPRGVLPAIEDWLATDAGREFERREDAELYGVTCHPGGWLRRRPLP
jgi:cephalosporin hydroxylase